MLDDSCATFKVATTFCAHSSHTQAPLQPLEVLKGGLVPLGVLKGGLVPLEVLKGGSDSS